MGDRLKFIFTNMVYRLIGRTDNNRVIKNKWRRVENLVFHLSRENNLLGLSYFLIINVW